MIDFMRQYDIFSGNAGNLSEMIEKGFRFTHLLALIHSTADKPGVQVVGATALATFAYNNIENQRRIIESGGITFHDLQHLLCSDDPLIRCHAAFQVMSHSNSLI